MRIAVPDLVSPSYFPAIAAVDLGLARDEGLDVELELLYPVTDAAEALRTGKIDFLAGAAHAPMHAFPAWSGVSLVAALSQHMYWFLVLRADLGIAHGDLGALGGLRIGAAPGPDLGLRRLLAVAGISGTSIGPVPATEGAGTSFGLAAAQALAEGLIDGFWANGMGAEVAVRRGVGTIVLDVRRGDGPKPCFNYTMASIATSDRLIERSPAVAAAAVRAIARTHAALKKDVTLATGIGRKLFPPSEAELITELIRRDLPYYDTTISRDFVTGMNRFARHVDILSGDVPYEKVVAMAV